MGITIASFKRNMTMFGFSIIERGKLNYSNKEYTKANREQNIPIIQARVKAKNKIDNDNKKRKNEEKDRLEDQPSEKLLKHTASIIQAIPVSNTSSPLVVVQHSDNFLIPSLDNITNTIRENSTSVSSTSKIKEVLKSKSIDDKLVIDEAENDIETISVGTPDINIEDTNDQVADATDQTGTQENGIDAELPTTIIPTSNSSVNIPSKNSGANSPKNLETQQNLQAYVLGMRHRHDEILLLNQKHKNEIHQLENQIRSLQETLLQQIQKNDQLTRTAEQAFTMGVREAQSKVFQSLHASMCKLNPVAYTQTYEIVNKSKKSFVNNFKSKNLL